MALKRAVGFQGRYLTSESVECASLPLQGIDYIHGGHGLPLGVLCVGDCVTDDVLQEHLQDSTSLLVDQSRDTLDTTSAGQTSDGRLGDALDVITKHLPVAFSATLSKTLSSFSTSRHSCVCIERAVRYAKRCRSHSLI